MQKNQFINFFLLSRFLGNLGLEIRAQQIDLKKRKVQSSGCLVMSSRKLRIDEEMVSTSPETLKWDLNSWMESAVLIAKKMGWNCTAHLLSEFCSVGNLPSHYISSGIKRNSPLDVDFLRNWSAYHYTDRNQLPLRSLEYDATPIIARFQSNWA